MEVRFKLTSSSRTHILNFFPNCFWEVFSWAEKLTQYRMSVNISNFTRSHGLLPQPHHPGPNYPFASFFLPYFFAHGSQTWNIGYLSVSPNISFVAKLYNFFLPWLYLWFFLHNSHNFSIEIIASHLKTCSHFLTTSPTSFIVVINISYQFILSLFQDSS